MLVIFRCYIVWGKLKLIIILPTFLVLLSAGQSPLYGSVVHLLIDSFQI